MNQFKMAATNTDCKPSPISQLWGAQLWGEESGRSCEMNFSILTMYNTKQRKVNLLVVVDNKEEGEYKMKNVFWKMCNGYWF